jgi:hypothetical protein
MNRILYDYAILVTQSCDILHAKDYLFVMLERADEKIRTLTASQADPLTASQSGLFTEDEFKKWIVNNLHPRFHFLESFTDEAGKLIELVANFRQVFTLRADYVREKLLPEGHRTLAMQDMYGTELGNRFGYFFSRVATDRNMQSL